jgi:putative hemolysin
MSGILIAAAGLLLLVSALLSAAESATFSVSSSRLRTMREEGFSGADTLHRVRTTMPEVRPTVFVANTVLNVLVASLLALGAAPMGSASAVGALVGGLLAVLLLAEGLPRMLASRRSVWLALRSAPTLAALGKLGAPFLAPFIRLDEYFQRRNGNGASDQVERELQELARLGKQEGVVEEEEHRLVERAFRMDELTAWDIMTPRVDIFAWPDSRTLEEVLPQLREVPHSRVPVYGQSIDDITGILYVRQAYEAVVAGRGEMKLSELAREPFFVPGSLPLPRLLQSFQLRRIHMGIVADEFGGTDGLVTLEDVIEELVGEIEDETDILEEPLVRISRSEAEVDGAVELREVNHALNVSLPHLEHRSLNGFVLETLGRVPVPGETLELPGLEIEILDASDTQVTRARLRKTQPVQPQEEG